MGPESFSDHLQRPLGRGHCPTQALTGAAGGPRAPGGPLRAAARVGADEIAEELGGLLPAKRHAAELAADALHRALGWAARSRASLATSERRTLVAMSGGVDSAV